MGDGGVLTRRSKGEGRLKTDRDMALDDARRRTPTTPQGEKDRLSFRGGDLFIGGGLDGSIV